MFISPIYVWDKQNDRSSVEFAFKVLNHVNRQSFPLSFTWTLVRKLYLVSKKLARRVLPNVITIDGILINRTIEYPSNLNTRCRTLFTNDRAWICKQKLKRSFTSKEMHPSNPSMLILKVSPYSRLFIRNSTEKKKGKVKRQRGRVWCGVCVCMCVGEGECERQKKKEERGKENLQLLERKHRKLYKDPLFQGHCLRVETGVSKRAQRWNS